MAKYKVVPAAMINDKKREAFEKDITKGGSWQELAERLPDGEYRWLDARSAWDIWQRAWKASRAALEIEMPPKLTQGDDYADGWNHALVLASGEIGIAGVRVKP